MTGKYFREDVTLVSARHARRNPWQVVDRAQWVQIILLLVETCVSFPVVNNRHNNGPPDRSFL